MDSTKTVPIERGTAHPGADALDNQRAFQLAHGGDDDDDRSAAWAICVNGFALGQELDTEFVQFVQHLEEVLRVASQAVASPYDDNIEATPVSVLLHPI